MDNREKHIRENEGHRHDEGIHSDMIADSLRAESKDRNRKDTTRINKIWLWLGVLILIAILIWWLFTYVIAFDVAGDENGMLMNVIDSFKLLC